MIFTLKQGNQCRFLSSKNLKKISYCIINRIFKNVKLCLNSRRFSGYALSMEEWWDKLEELSNDIEDRNDVGTTVFTTSYSSPFVEADKRRNEV